MNTMAMSLRITLMTASVFLVACNPTTGKPQLMSPFGGAAMTSQAQYKAINPKNVVLYSANNRPAHYRVVGFVGASRENLIGLPRTPEHTNNELRQQAANIGANGVIDIFMGEAETTGKAIVSY